MSTRLITLKDFTYNKHEFDILRVIVDDQFSPPLLPLLYTTHLSRFGTVLEAREFSNETLRERFSSLHFNDIEDNTIKAYTYCLNRFLNHLDDNQEKHNMPDSHFSSACNERLVNDYLNNILAKELGSAKSLEIHRCALLAYFNWLDYMEICPRLNINIYRTTKKYVAKKSKKQHYIQYIPRYKRMNLLNTCKTLAEKLIIRMGCEVGLRTCELMGLRVNGNNDLNSLFKQVSYDNDSHAEQYRYWLHGTHTKGSKSRFIYFSHQLLIDMKRYFDTERQRIADQAGTDDGSFFLRTDNRFYGIGITQSQGTKVFNRYKEETNLNPLLSFHDLRHTFATELFHEEKSGPDGRETRSESAALIVVAQRLGHAIGRNGHATKSTTIYVRMEMEMKLMEEE